MGDWPLVCVCACALCVCVCVCVCVVCVCVYCTHMQKITLYTVTLCVDFYRLESVGLVIQSMQDITL